MLQLLFLAVFHNRHLSKSPWSWLAAKLYKNLTVRTHPARYRIKLQHQTIQNNVRQIIIILYEKSLFNSLVWGSLTLAQLMSY